MNTTPTSPDLVRRLLAAQFPQWAGLGVEAVGVVGTANAVYRVGGGLSVRLPLGEGAARDVGKERRWLPVIGAAVPVGVPEAVAVGVPGEGFPWPWAVHTWLDGESPVPGRLADPAGVAADLAGFVLALRGIDAEGAPPAYRSEALADRDGETRRAAAQVRDAVDPEVVAGVWSAALAAEPHPGPPVWLHSDLQPGNLLLTGGRLTGVIDFGCLGVGDPAVDLIPAWYVLPAAVRPLFREAVGADGAAWARARGWALSVALMELAAYRTANPRMASIAAHVLGGISAEHPGR
ncbi:aminoglycoside phosphotransferase family protein [Actinacidiphila bryophytorum]|uniref:Phosphotransferase n=2 Tax=Actinacidiphila bryophytorum TaxID=1436133 RepID=A0A9W4H5F2_9ACTN|nr:aminoglycoside phosphotransferase family protein [Actinacidiphila bryophytorum]MBM9437440.1 aminoglycoside phosphotransferase family protein [Actinacidiphila bryophytorum]CAG7652135.1 Phosphotransferase [Actinacidiphila bryophytorum]